MITLENIVPGNRIEYTFPCGHSEERRTIEITEVRPSGRVVFNSPQSAWPISHNNIRELVSDLNEYHAVVV
jgi:hypothetical protein